MEQKGLTLVPLELYFRNGRAKVVLALGRGKKTHDKREALKRRVSEREAARDVSRGLSRAAREPVIAALALVAALGLGAPGQITIAGAARGDQVPVPHRSRRRAGGFRGPVARARSTAPCGSTRGGRK